ncbi:MAG: hypothetical protein HFI00_10760 [Lachnospiraceae bacterium]|nr:hypothetical protein [Lachnospiraceae bacterium]
MVLQTTILMPCNTKTSRGLCRHKELFRFATTSRKSMSTPRKRYRTIVGMSARDVS